MHYFHDLEKFFSVLFKILKPNGTLIICDFHPFSRIVSANKILTKEETSEVNYFDSSVQNGDVAYKQYFSESEHDLFPDVMVRHYTLSDIINAVIQAGFNLREFNEHPGWIYKERPGEFTIVAKK